jgi:hypothetical protein
MSGEVVWSINIMIAILLVAVGYSIYWIFMYDSWYPNEQSEDSSIGISSEPIAGEAEGTH